MTDDEPQQPGVKTTETIVEIIETLRDLDGASAATLSDHLGMSRSWTYEHLVTLEKLEYVVNEDGTYRLGLRFLDHGKYVKSRMRIHQLVQSSIAHLAEETGELVRFGVEEHGRVFQLNEAAGERAVAVDRWLGEHTHMHYLALGKSMLAYMPESRVREILDRHGLPEMTNETITDEGKLFDELEEIRERDGISFIDSELEAGVRAVGAPIIHSEDIVGAISVSGPANRLKGPLFRETIPEQIRATTNEVELKLLTELE
ncbi:IclR family transcriptional regulator [Halorarum halobium]|uniref:IclR family transcriptional regulator n=1 Tax=Halorarum halobium TaxID=3075121 RepID=UPI0028A68D06|nr:IclR family transcriptional regulator [Halobaculum sp. XH14]